MLETRLHDVPHPPHLVCERTTFGQWQRAWLSELSFLVPGVLDCIAYDLTLHFSSSSAKWMSFENTPGVEVRPLGFGGVDGVSSFGANSYFGLMIDHFVAQYGYVPGVSFRGAPFDWRWSTAECAQNGIFAAVQTLIEETYALNNGTRVHLLGHSYGAPWVKAFLSEFVPQTWKDKYVARFWGVSGAWVGAPLASYALSAGINLAAKPGSTTNMSATVYDWLTSMPSVVQLHPRGAGDTQGVLIRTPEAQYDASNVTQLYAPAAQTLMAYYGASGAFDGMAAHAPGVDTVCVHGYGIATPRVFEFGGAVVPGSVPTRVETVDGDGVVTLDGLDGACEAWRVGGLNAGRDVEVLRFFNLTHDDSVRSPLLWDLVASYAVKP